MYFLRAEATDREKTNLGKEEPATDERGMLDEWSVCKPLLGYQDFEEELAETSVSKGGTSIACEKEDQTLYTGYRSAAIKIDTRGRSDNPKA